MSPKRNRRKWVCYSPEYTPGLGKNCYAYSKRQMMAILRSWGVGAQAHAVYLIKGRDGSLSWWNVKPNEPMWEFIGTTGTV